jgi:hypothetical protein
MVNDIGKIIISLYFSEVSRYSYIPFDSTLPFNPRITTNINYDYYILYVRSFIRGLWCDSPVQTRIKFVNQASELTKNTKYHLNLFSVFGEES